VVVDKRSESTVFTGTVQRLRPEGHVVVRVDKPESEAKRLVVGTPSDFMEVAG
jgi:hypothetical protein